MSDKHKLYISFAEEDNSKGQNKTGWVDDFARFLHVYIQRINGESPDIILLPSKDKAPSLGDKDGLILVYSDNYKTKNLVKRDAASLSDYQKVFKIELKPSAKSSQPQEIRYLNDFPFFARSEEKDGGIITLNSLTVGPTFWLKIIDLAFEINRLVYKNTKSWVESATKTIYLAETSYDQVSNRDELKRELIRHGHTVLPLAPLSSDSNELEKQVKECLEKADLTIHIIGEEYGDSPDGTDKSIVQIQNDQSTAYFAEQNEGENASLHRLIWMPINLRPKSDQQKLYLDTLRDDITSTSGAEIIQTPLEILKTVIHSRLQVFDAEAKSKMAETKKKSDIKSVYLLYDRKDSSDISEIVQNLNAKNIQVITPEFEGKQIEFLEKHRESLVQSDGVLLYANRNLNWVNSKLNDVIKAPGFGKLTPFEAKAIFIKDESIPKEKISRFGDVIMLNGNGKSHTADLTPFLDKIAKK